MFDKEKDINVENVVKPTNSFSPWFLQQLSLLPKDA
jgi:hypothetical protein